MRQRDCVNLIYHRVEWSRQEQFSRLPILFNKFEKGQKFSSEKIVPPGNVTIRVTNLSHEKEIILRKGNNATTCGVGHIIPSSIQDPLKALKVSRQSATLSSAPNTSRRTVIFERNFNCFHRTKFSILILNWHQLWKVLIEHGSWLLQGKMKLP